MPPFARFISENLFYKLHCICCNDELLVCGDYENLDLGVSSCDVNCASYAVLSVVDLLFDSVLVYVFAHERAVVGGQGLYFLDGVLHLRFRRFRYFG